ncbi:MAG: protoporphyrinogen/coproporphyrinogen oxidase [Gemmatimonadota bacterium]
MRIVILGAGPTGLGAAWRLQERGHDDWLLVESSDRAGGLAMSITDEAGFTWDLGGHVLFSHWKYFDRLMEKALGDAWVEHEREAWVWMRERWIPYPFQNNIWRLPAEELADCLSGLVDVHRAAWNCPPANFAQWLQRAFGDGLCRAFMYPYNFKVWAWPPESMGVGWMGERVATVDLARVLRNLVHRADDVSWGPNATFRFPRHGGTGAIWTSIAAQLPADQLKFSTHVVSIDPHARELRCADGSTIGYDRLVSSMPLDRLLTTLDGVPDLAVLSSRFVHSSSHIVGIGFEGQPPASLATKCWMYFPEPETPFYRVTVFSNYSPYNVARPGEQWSLMAEVSESAAKGVRQETLIDEVLAGFVRVGFVKKDARPVTRFHRRLEHGYPTPWLARDEVLAQTLPRLQSMGIFSRGRFGAWRYEVSNQDHSCLQGVEAVDHILTGVEEATVTGVMGVEPPEV